MTKLTRWFTAIGLSGVCLAVVNCNDRQPILPIEFNDPYLNSFRGKNIKYVIQQNEDQHLYPDTIELDKAGNIIRIKSWFVTELLSYDSIGFLQRKLHVSDIVLNYVIKYSPKGDTLQQTWREINSSDWNLGMDTSSIRHHVVLYIYNSKGRIESEQVYGRNLIKYSYDDDLLVKKDAYTSIHPMEFSNIYQYEYDTNSVLKRIVRTYSSQEKEITIFFDGLPYSRTTEEGEYKYQYVYY